MFLLLYCEIEMKIYKTLTNLHKDFQILAAPLNENQKNKVNSWETPHHSFSDHAMGGLDKHTVEVPLKEKHILPPKHIVKALGEAGHSEVNYSKGVVKDKYGREIKIGKALAKAGKHKELKDYENDPQRSAKSEHKVIISRHPHDVAGMSTNQGWTSCMNIKNGIYKSKLKDDVKHGTHVAYLVHKDATNTDKPVARIALKPYVNQQDKKILRPENKTYGTSNSNFHKTVDAWSKKHFPAKDGVYKKHEDVYNDDGSEHVGNGSVSEHGATKHYKNGKLHRDGDKPAVEHADGYKAYWKNGKRHRDGDKPAVERANGDKAYYKNGKRHRDGDKPAVEYANGAKKYYKNGKLHRDGDKPAVEHANGYKTYYKNDKHYTPKAK